MNLDRKENMTNFTKIYSSQIGKENLNKNIFTEEFIENYENKNLTLGSFLILIFLISCVLIYSLFNVLTYLPDSLWGLLFITGLLNIHILLLSVFTNYLVKINIYLKYILLSMIFVYRISFIIFSVNIKETTNNEKVYIQSLLFLMFCVCILVYGYYNNSIINKMKEQLLRKENINDVHLNYANNLIEKMMCLYFTFADDKFLFANDSAKFFLENNLNDQIEANGNISKKSESKRKLNYKN
jgi:hypothetical protein